MIQFYYRGESIYSHALLPTTLMSSKIYKKRGYMAKKKSGMNTGFFVDYGILTTFFCFSLHLLTPRQAS